MPAELPPRIFLLSPANCGGKRAELLLGGRGKFALAYELQDGGTITLGEAFSFMSGLYFRGKLTYARRFACPPTGVAGIHIITTNRGLLSPDTPVTTDDLREFATGEIQPLEPRYRNPLLRDLRAIESSRDSAQPDIVLLGSIATAKYVDVLLEVIGERLLFPSEFVGRGDMSRGAMLLRATRAGAELDYTPIATAVRRGQRPTKLQPSSAETSNADDTTTPTAAASIDD